MKPARSHIAACAAAAIVLLTACGSPASVHTLDHTADFGSTATPLTHALPSGLADAGVDGPRLLAGCNAVNAHTAGTGSPVFTGRHCEWAGNSSIPLIVGMIDRSGASFTLNETKVYLDGLRPVDGVGQRAEYDPQSHALYVIIGGRLWYVQLVGKPGLDPAALGHLTMIARVIAGTPAAQ
jgi:hypothetical protein